MKTKKEEKTVPAVFCNILRGVGSVASIFPADGEPRRVSMPERTDSQALAGDWEKMGRDFKRAVEKISNEQKKTAL